MGIDKGFFLFFWTNNGTVATDHMLQFTFGCVLLLMSLQQKSPKNPPPN